MEILLTDQQKFRQERNNAIIKEYHDTFNPDGSIVEWCRRMAKKKKISYSTVYGIVAKLSNKDVIKALS